MPSWLSEWVGADMAPLAYYALVAAIILVLILLVLAVARNVMGAGTGPRVKGRGPRLAVMDVASIDPKRRLVLVRRDEIEHLLLIGGQNDLVVEAGILRVPANARTPRAEPQLRQDFEPEPAAERAPSQRAAAPQPAMRRPSPAPVAAQPPMPAPPIEAAAERAPDLRPASPLSRPVPRPAPQRAASRPAPAFPEPDVADRVEPEMRGPEEPIAAGPAAPVVEPPILADAGPRPDAPRTPAVEPAARPQRAEPVMSTPPSRPPAPEPAPRAPIVAPPVPVARPPSRDAIAPSRDAIAPSGTPGGAAAPAQRPAPAPLARIPVNNAGEPARRPLSAQTVQPIQPRSMATPTYPAKPASAGLASGTNATDDPALDGSETKGAEPPVDVVLAKLLAPSVGGASAPLPEATVIEPAPDARAVPERTPSATSIASPTDDPAPSVGDGDKRPLSVRSFATAIQTRQASETTVVPQMPAPAPAERGDPAVDVPQAPAPSASLVAPLTGTAQPMAPKETRGGSEDEALDDFLSSQLDSALGDEIWTPKDGSAAIQPVAPVVPSVRPDSVPPRAEAAVPPRAPTLEEEMERLLGDFDLETTDRSIR